MRRLMVLLFLWLGTGSLLWAQPYKEARTRHRFAQLTLGMQYRYHLPRASRYFTAQAQGWQAQPFKAPQEAALIFGGTHFWGHADFYVSVPFPLRAEQALSSGTETGFKIYPWPIEDKRLRPFLGLSFNGQSYQQGQGTKLERSAFPWHGGFSLLRGQQLWELGFSYFPRAELDYYLTRSYRASLRLPQWTINFSYKWMLETTLSAEKDWLSGRTAAVTEKLAAAGKLNAFTFAIGPSSAFFTGDNTALLASYPFLGPHRSARVFPEWGLGYYWHKPDIQVNLSYRRISSQAEAFEHRHLAERQALSLETFLFLSDYHGFAFFAGPVLSYESLRVQHWQQNRVLERGRFRGLAPGLVFGWDIRPNRLQGFVLRTNLRYFPRLAVPMTGGNRFSFQQLEFNFIQLVIYPERMF